MYLLEIAAPLSWSWSLTHPVVEIINGDRIFISENFLSPFAVSHALQRLLNVLHHWLNFLPDDVPGGCYDLLFIFSSYFSPLLFLVFWFSFAGTQEFLPP